MGRLSDTLTDAIIDQVFGGVAWTPPATLHIGLSSTQPGNDGSGVTEPSGGGYARAAVANDTTNWPAASGRTKSNGTAITFPTATADWLGGVAAGYFVVYDAATAGGFMGWGALATPQAFNSGSTPTFPAGSFVVSGPGS